MLGPAGTCFAASASISGLRSVPTTTPVDLQDGGTRQFRRQRSCISRLLEYQQDIAFSTPFGPSNPAFGPQVVFGHMHDEPLSGEHVGNAIRLRPEIGILCAVADAAWRAALPPTSIRSETV
jgi:hypothetical protein